MWEIKKYTLPFLVLFIGVSVAVLGKYYEFWNAKQVVPAAQMEEYVETYLQKYEYEYSVWNKILPTDQNSFYFLKINHF